MAQTCIQRSLKVQRCTYTFHRPTRYVILQCQVWLGMCARSTSELASVDISFVTSHMKPRMGAMGGACTRVCTRIVMGIDLGRSPVGFMGLVFTRCHFFLKAPSCIKRQADGAGSGAAHGGCLSDLRRGRMADGR